MWGYIIRQTHDPYSVRDAANKLGLKDIEIDTKGKTKKNINYEKNYTAWRNFVMEKLDHDRTFVNVDDIEEFMTLVYSTLVGNKYQMADGASFIFGTKITRNIAKKAEFKRVLHFKSASDWFAYNDIFGMGNLKESFIVLPWQGTGKQKLHFMKKWNHNPLILMVSQKLRLKKF